MSIIHTTWTIDIYKGIGFISYPAGTPALAMSLSGSSKFHIYRATYRTDGGPMRYVRLTQGFLSFQRIWRARRAWMRRMLRWLRERELGRKQSLPPYRWIGP